MNRIGEMLSNLSAVPRFFWRRVKAQLIYAFCWVRANYRWLFPIGVKRDNPLPHPLIISLTSYPPRFGTLAMTLKCLLRQTIRPTATILWIAQADRAKLPYSVTRLVKHGLTIEYCDDLKSFKKIIPALEKYPDSYIVTADDELYYWPKWLEELVDAHDPTRLEVVCHRMHRIRLAANGLPRPYLEWELNSGRRESGFLNFPTGGAGVLFPPGALHPDATRKEIFANLCAQADDVWLYWMLIRNNVRVRKIGRVVEFLYWRNSQQASLFETNMYQNDGYIRNLIARYGFPIRGEIEGCEEAVAEAAFPRAPWAQTRA